MNVMASSADPIWDRYLTERDREVAARSGYGARGGLGRRPALLVIDANVNFCGDRPEPLFASMERWRNSCGQAAWGAAGEIARLLDAARTAEIPVLYSTNQTPRADGLDSGRWRSKNSRRMEDATATRCNGNDIIAPIAPQPRDLVIRKTKPSVFFGTPLLSLLVDFGVDSLLCCGGTTSGCVRATVVDAFSNNFHVGVVQEACFDRTEASHAINLFDLDQKYADVMSADTALAYLKGLPARPLAPRFPPVATQEPR